MSDEDYILNLWNMGLSRLQVIKEYMKRNNKIAKENKYVDKITMQQAMKYVEPILFRYETNRMKG